MKKQLRYTIAMTRVALALAFGLTPALAQQPAGTIRAWGDNLYGELGNGTLSNSNVPEEVINLSEVLAIGRGGLHSLALKSDGSVWAWGANGVGQLGNGTTTDSTTPVAVSGLGSGSGAMAICGGYLHSLALKSDGSVWAWGSNLHGQLGNGTITDSGTPVAVSGLSSGSGVIAIAVGTDYSMALKSDGSVWAWGFNDFGQLGDGTNFDRHIPVAVSGLESGSGVVAIAAGNAHSMALKSDGSIWAWGDNTSGQLGDGTTTGSGTPVAVSGLGSGSGVIATAAGLYHSMALKSDGSVWAWGDNLSGELGNGTNTNSTIPVAVSGLDAGSGVIAIAGGEFFSLAMKSDGSAWAWGRNFEGELGHGTNTTTNTPVQVLGLNGGVALAPGNSGLYSLAVVEPVAALSTNAISYPDFPVGTVSPPVMLTITNNGQDPLDIDSFALSGPAASDFQVSAPPTPINVAPGTSTAFGVSFAPSAAGARVATLEINDNGFQSPQSVTLSGNAVLLADISVGLGASPTPVRNRASLTYTISVKNGGPTYAPAVVMTDSLPAGSVFTSGTTTQGSCLTPAPGTTGMVTCLLGILNSGAAVTITLTVTVNAIGGSSLTNTASASSSSLDSNLADNSVTVVTRVFGSRH